MRLLYNTLYSLLEGFKVKEKKKSGFFAEFKKFILRGNVIDLAVGVIIGGAFQKIITSLVDDIVMPLLGSVTGGLDFSEKMLKVNGVDVLWGSFITSVINFLLMAFVIFCIIKAINTVSDKLSKEKEEKPEATTKVCPYCQSEISIKATRCPNCTSEL